LEDHLNVADLLIAVIVTRLKVQLFGDHYGSSTIFAA